LTQSIADAKLVRRTKSLMYLGYVTDGVLISLNRVTYLYITINSHSAIDRDIADSRADRADILSSIILSPIRLNIELSLVISDRVQRL